MAFSTDDSVVGDKYRSHIHGEGEKNTKWKYGAPPNFDVVNKLFEEGRTNVWPKGSLEERVQAIVKTWDMEIFHKTCIDDFKTLNPEKFTVSLNGGPTHGLEDVLVGGYKALLQTSLPESLRAYNPAVETFESSHEAFTTAFPRGFALEILEVYSGPPTIVYKFRHWSFMEGPFKGHAPTGELVEFYGIGIFKVDESMKIEKVELFYDHSQLIGSLLKGPLLDDASQSPGTSAIGCPFLNRQ
ncbi:hypothetical protein AAC387_Pa04g2632 [Persea americana]